MMAQAGLYTVTPHAIERYQQRVANVTVAEAIAALSGPAFQIIHAIGRGAVRLPSGHRAICENGVVTTVLTKGSRASWDRSDVQP